MGAKEALASTNWREPRPSSSSPPPSCSAQQTHLRPDEVELGLFTYFDWHSLPTDSIAHTQPWLNEGATDHPAIIVGRKGSGNVVVCPTTSFGGELIQSKIPREEHVGRRLALAIQFRQETTAHNGLPILQLKTGANKKQTYVKLDQFFEVEARHLRLFGGRRETTCLRQESVTILHQHLQDLLSGKTPARPQRSNVPLSPMHTRTWTPEDLGIPTHHERSTSSAPSPAPLADSRDFARTINTAVQASSSSSSYPRFSSGRRGAVSRVSIHPHRTVPAFSTTPKRDIHAIKSWRRTSGNGIRKVSSTALEAH